MQENKAYVNIDRYIDRLITESTPDLPIWNIESIRQGKKPHWNYIDGCMITSLLQMNQITGDEKYFNFNARTYTQKLLQNAKHQEDLHDEKTVCVNIDGFTRGTGTASCGPDILPQFEVDGSKGLEFSFYMMPVKK